MTTEQPRRDDVAARVARIVPEAATGDDRQPSLLTLARQTPAGVKSALLSLVFGRAVRKVFFAVSRTGLQLCARHDRPVGGRRERSEPLPT